MPEIINNESSYLGKNRLIRKVAELNRRANDWYSGFLGAQLSSEREQALRAAIISIRTDIVLSDRSPDLVKSNPLIRKLSYLFDNLESAYYKIYLPFRKNPVVEELGISGSMFLMQIPALFLYSNARIEATGLKLEDISREKGKLRYLGKSMKWMGNWLSNRNIPNFFLEAPLVLQMGCDLKSEVDASTMNNDEQEATYQRVVNRYGMENRDPKAVKDWLKSLAIFPLLTVVREGLGWGSWGLELAVPSLRDWVSRFSYVEMAEAYAVWTSLRMGVTYLALNKGWSSDLLATTLSVPGIKKSKESEKASRSEVLASVLSVGLGNVSQLAQCAALIPFAEKTFNIPRDTSAKILFGSFFFDEAAFIGFDIFAYHKQLITKRNSDSNGVTKKDAA